MTDDSNTMKKKRFILEDFNERAIKFVEALFHTWSAQDQEDYYSPGKYKDKKKAEPKI